MARDDQDDDASGEGELRIDRWLWCARFYKSRSAAAEAVRAGHVRLNGRRVKPAHDVQIGDALAVDRGGSIEQELRVAAIPARRGPAAEAQACYVETPESLERRRRHAEERKATAGAMAPPTEGRPDKRTRRLLLRRQRG